MRGQTAAVLLMAAMPSKSKVKMDASVLPQASEAVITYFDNSVGHNLQTLPQDLTHTFFIAAFGLAGAYLTQGAVANEGFEQTDVNTDTYEYDDFDPGFDTRSPRPRKRRQRLEPVDPWEDDEYD